MEPVQPCRWCGEAHGPLCPYVKALEFGPAGDITRVEFLTMADMAPARQENETAEPEPDYPRFGPSRRAPPDEPKD